MGSSEGQGMQGVLSKPGNLEAKKQKLLECGTAIQSVRVCTICNVACNGEKAFADHLVGKKHVTQERALCTKASLNPISESNFKTKSQDDTKKTRENGASLLCEVCRISCTSSDCLNTHRLGKKHQMNLQKLQNANTSTASPPSTAVWLPSTNPSTRVLENTEADRAFVPASQVKKKVALSKVLEDVEAKKWKEQALCTKANTNPISHSNFESKSQDDANKTRENGASPCCAICRISFTSSDCLNTHRQGKKHQKNFRKLQNASINATSPPSTALPPSTNLSTEVPENTEADNTFVSASQVKKKVAQSKVLEDVEAKKWKERALCPKANSNPISASNFKTESQDDAKKIRENGASPCCELCRISCTSSDCLNTHRQGKKHQKNLQKLQNANTSTTSPPSTAASLPSTNPSTGVRENTEADKAFVPASQVKKKERALCTKATWNRISESNSKTKAQDNTNKTTENRASLWCEVCRIRYTSSDCLNTHSHRQGKQHQKNLQKFQNSNTNTISPPSTAASWPSTNPSTGVPENTEVNRASQMKKVAQSKVLEDAEVKKWKVLDCRAAADAVRTCVICNVVCNSETLFKLHLAGRKHVAMVKQVAESERALCTKANSNFETKSQDNTNKTRENRASLWCEFCRISCTSSDCLNTHKQGKKHQKNLQKLRNANTSTASPPSTAALLPSTKPSTRVPENTEADKAFVPALQVKKVAPSKVLEDEEAKKQKERALCTNANSNRISESYSNTKSQDNTNKTRENGASPWCVVCRISFSSINCLNTHRQGKKHQKNLQKFQDLNTASPPSIAAWPPSTNSCTGIPENTEADTVSVPASQVKKIAKLKVLKDVEAIVELLQRCC